MPIKDPCALLDELTKEPSESEWLEFKQSFWDHEQTGRNCSALANAAMLVDRDRAFIVFGVENKTYRKTGTTIRLKQKKVKGQNFENWLNDKLAPRTTVEMLDFVCDGLHFSLIAIEPAYTSPIAFDKLHYIRVGENTKRLDEFPDRLRAIWLKTGVRGFEDSVVSPNVSADQVFELIDVDAFYSLREEAVPGSKAEKLKALAAARMIQDTKEGTYDITNMGALLLATDLDRFPTLRSKQLRVIKYLGANKMKSEPEIRLTAGYACGFESHLKHIFSRLQEESTRGGRRTIQIPYPEDMLRETVANALVHQDLSVSGAGPMVEIFSNRVEISNPGRSLISRDRMINEKRSRNEKMAAAMRDFKLCEERGSGLDKAFQAAEDAGMPAPDPVISDATTQMTLLAPSAFGSMTKAEKLRSLYYHCALRFAARDYMTNASLRERFKLPASKMQVITDLITTAKKGKKIVPADPDQGKKGAMYVPYWAAGVDDG